MPTHVGLMPADLLPDGGSVALQGAQQRRRAPGALRIAHRLLALVEQRPGTGIHGSHQQRERSVEINEFGEPAVP